MSVQLVIDSEKMKCIFFHPVLLCDLCGLKIHRIKALKTMSKILLPCRDCCGKRIGQDNPTIKLWG